MRHALLASAAGAVAVALQSQMAWPWTGLAFVWLVPWFAALDALARPWQALVAGWAMSLALASGVFAWFPPAVAHYTGWPTWLAWAAFLALAPLLEPQCVVVPLVRRRLCARGLAWWAVGLGTAAGWVAVEWAMPKLFGDTLGHGLTNARWLRQAADLGGTPLLTVVLVVVNEAALAAVRAARVAVRDAVAPAAVAVALVGVLAAYGAARCAALDAAPPASRLTAGLVQANLAGYEELGAAIGTYEAVRGILKLHLALSRNALAAAPLDLVVWPETVYPTTFGRPKSPEARGFDAIIARVPVASRVPLVFGTYDAGDDGSEYNAAVALDVTPDGRIEPPQTYRKASLFPLTERVPAWLEWARPWLPWMGTWKPGGEAGTIAVHRRDGHVVRVAPLVCYDDVAPRFALDAARRGAEVLLALSNDSWFIRGDGALLHLAMARFRSIETRRPMLRVTNTGISAVVDASGDVVSEVSPGARAVLVGSVVPATPATLAVLLGDWVGPIAAAAALLLLLAPTRATPAQPAQRDQPVAAAPRVRRRAAGRGR